MFCRKEWSAIIAYDEEAIEKARLEKLKQVAGESGADTTFTTATTGAVDDKKSQ